MVKAWTALLLAGLSVAGSATWGQGYPSQPIRLIVPFGPGSGSDIVARRLGLSLQQRWKQPGVIDNRPGAQGMIGTELLRNASADGWFRNLPRTPGRIHAESSSAMPIRSLRCPASCCDPA